ncbi:MAG: hypothetical protein WDM76_19225 [Limisphaerales bacterium]
MTSSVVWREAKRLLLATRNAASPLVVTLILLSVITFMAVTFLVISRREKGSVTTVTDTAMARYAADAALANAEAQIIANIFVNGNIVHHQSLQFRPARLDEFYQSQWISKRISSFTKRQLSISKRKSFESK